MDFNFTHEAPHPKTLKASHQLIDQIWSQCAALKIKLSQVEAQVNINSSNSSLPPSSDSIKNKAEKRKERDEWRKRTPIYWKKRRQGAQPGHKGTGRTFISLDEVDEIIPCCPKLTCEACSGCIKVGKIRQRKQVFDLPVGSLQVKEYQIYGGYCLQCKKRHRGALPDGTPSGILGVNALAKIAALTGKYRLSKREVKAFLFDFFGLKISIGSVSNAERIVSESLKKPTEAIGETLIKQPYLHADETSHYHRGHLGWLWVATNNQLTYFKIYQHRNQACAKALIGENFAGMLITDRYGAYNWLPQDKRQYCWAHLKRDFKKIAERSDNKESRIGYGLQASLSAIFHYWRKIRDSTHLPYYELLLRRATKRLYTCLRRGRKLTGTKTARFCAKLIRERKSLWHFLHHKSISATNNHAERQLRHGVIWRKKCYGTQSNRGILFVERILTIVKTCMQKGRSLIDFIAQSIQSHWHRSCPPSLVTD